MLPSADIDDLHLYKLSHQSGAYFAFLATTHSAFFIFDIDI